MTSFAGYEGALRASVAAGQLDRVRTRYSLEFEDEGQLQQAAAETILRQEPAENSSEGLDLDGEGVAACWRKHPF